MIIAPYCCCDPLPPTIEFKRIGLYFPYPGLARFIDSGVHDSEWVAKHYLKHIESVTGYEGTRVTTTTYDPVTNFKTVEVVQSPDFSLGSALPGTDQGAFESETYYWFGYDAAAAFPAVGPTKTVRFDITLADEILFSDVLSFWQAQLETYAPASAMASENLVDVYVPDINQDRTVRFNFPSEIQGVIYYEAAHLLSITPKKVTPWNGEYHALAIGGNTSGVVETTLGFTWYGNNIFAGFQAVGTGNIFGTVNNPINGLSSFITFDSEINAYRMSGNVFVIFRTCLRSILGLGCSVTYQPPTMRNVVKWMVDPDTGIVSQNEAVNLQLAPGAYTFTGDTVIVHQGARIAPTPDNLVGLDGVPNTIGAVLNLGFSGPGVPAAINNIPPNCPP